MSNPFVQSADQANREPVDSGAFKKEFQTVGRPPVVENINDAYVRDGAPDNLGGAKRTSNPGKKEGAYDVEEPEVGVTGESTGRRQATFEQINAEETSVHPNNPPQ